MGRIMASAWMPVAGLALGILAITGCKDAPKTDATESSGRAEAAKSCTGDQLCDIGTKCGGFPSKEVCLQKSKEASDACPKRDAHTACSCECYAKASPKEDCGLWQQCASECFRKHCQ